MSATRSPAPERQRDPVQRDRRPVADDELAHFDERGHSELEPEVRGDHLRVAPDSVGRAVGDHTPAVEHDDAFGERADELHVVLDQHHGEPTPGEGSQRVDEPGLLSRA